MGSGWLEEGHTTTRMPRVKPDERKRARRPKARTGCITCKSRSSSINHVGLVSIDDPAVRRIKCDETKPFCFKCTSTGRKCDGYESPSSSERAVIVKAWPLSSVFKDAQERRAFSFFQARTKVQLAGFYECEFWDRVLLQAAHEDPGIRHGLIALASLHEEFEQKGDANFHGLDFALRQYNLAIRQRLDKMSQISLTVQNTDTYLASCMVFICIELIQGHYLSSMSLLQGALKLLYDSNRDGQTVSAWPLEVFEALLCRLQAQAVGLVGFSINFEPSPPFLLRSKLLHLPAIFASIAEARDWMDFFHWSHSLARKRTDSAGYLIEVLGKAGFFFEILIRWSEAFDSLLNTLGNNLSDRDHQAIVILQIRRIMTKTSIEMACKRLEAIPQQIVADGFQDDFEAVILLAESLVPQPGSPSYSKSFLFTMDYGLVSPLYDIARICRDPGIRRRAIHLLRAKPCREGLWDGLLAAHVLERVVELEEGMVPNVFCAADVPVWARIFEVVPEFHPGKRSVTVTFTRESEDSHIIESQEVIDLPSREALEPEDIPNRLTSLQLLRP